MFHKERSVEKKKTFWGVDTEWIQIELNENFLLMRRNGGREITFT